MEQKQAGRLPYIIPLEKLRLDDADRAGSKAARLGELAAGNRFLVPPGFVITADAHRDFLELNRFEPARPPDVHSFEEGRLPPGLAVELKAALRSWEDQPLAVRSSALAEDLPASSYAGLYETSLEVQGYPALEKAVRQCWASAASRRVLAYRARTGSVTPAASAMAVLVQPFIQGEASGIAFSQNPLTGQPDEALVSGVTGTGALLTGGQVTPEEWSVNGSLVRPLNGEPATVLDAWQVEQVAAAARQVAAHFGSPHEIEWTLAGGRLYLLQARPVTALPAGHGAGAVRWEAPLPGVWSRNFRLGEWLSGPVTPLFESWLLPRLEARLAAGLRNDCGLAQAGPEHLVVNGWYFYGLNFFPAARLKMLALLFRGVLPAFIRQPRKVFLAVASLNVPRFGMEPFVREMEQRQAPFYRSLVAAGWQEVDQAVPLRLCRLVDEVIDAAGDYFWLLIMSGGYAWKAEQALAKFYRRYLSAGPDDSHQALLTACYRPEPPAPHAVTTLDWFEPTLGELGLPPYDPDEAARRYERQRSVQQAAETAARQRLAGQPRRLKEFERRLALARRYIPVREQQVAEFTLGWPLLRRALARLGSHLCRQGNLDQPAGIYFLTRTEVEAGLSAGDGLSCHLEVRHRRQEWAWQRHLTPPLLLGQPAPPIRQVLEAGESFRSSVTPHPGRAELRGLPASPGRSTGPARIILNPAEAERLQPGEILVVPAAAPGWTPLFSRAAGLVTNTGSPVAHASLLAREYGLPAVVGTIEATTRLRDGQLLTVDGNAGTVYYS